MTESRIFKIFVCVLACIEVIFASFTFVCGYLCPDHAEHLHASWLVWQGNIPYEDFFEHHNPLLWYLWAPVMALFYHNAIILYVAKAVNFLVYAVMFWGMYRISKDFLKISGKVFVFALCMLFLNKMFIFTLFEFSPDSFMWASFVWGLYFYFKFLEYSKQKYLNLSFFLFIISFLFLQKILLNLFLLGCYTLYLLFRKHIHIRSVLQASILPLFLICFGGGVLLCRGILEQYYRLNYELNFMMPYFFGSRKYVDNLAMAYLVPLAMLCCLRPFLKCTNKYGVIIVFLVVAEYLFKIIVWAPWVQYYIFIHICCWLIIGEVLLKLKKTLVVVLGGGTLLAGQLLLANHETMRWNYRLYYQIHKYIMDRTAKDDYLFNSSDVYFNIYGKDTGYYWFGFQNIALVSYYMYGYGHMDLGQLLYMPKPKFFYFIPYFNWMALDRDQSEYRTYLKTVYNKVPNFGEGAEAFANRWSQFYVFALDEGFFNQYYQLTPYNPLLVRKD